MIQNVPVTRCACGHLYSSDEWARTQFVGYVGVGRDAAGELLEIRRCTACGEGIYLDCGEQPDPRSPASLGRIISQVAHRRVPVDAITLPAPSTPTQPGE